jgi:hypothetical protein
MIKPARGHYKMGSHKKKKKTTLLGINNTYYSRRNGRARRIETSLDAMDWKKLR